MRRRSRHDGLDEEGLLAPALLVAPHDAEAPALVVGLLQDDVAAPVHVAGTRRHSVRITGPWGGGAVLRTTLPGQPEPASPQRRPVEAVVSGVVSDVQLVLVVGLGQLLRIFGEGLDDPQDHLGLSRLGLQDRDGLCVGQLGQVYAIDAEEDVA